MKLFGKTICNLSTHTKLHNVYELVEFPQL